MKILLKWVSVIVIVTIVSVQTAGADVTLPFDVNDSALLGYFNPGADVVFDTNDGTYTIDGVSQPGAGRILTMEFNLCWLETMVFDFNGITLAPDITVTAVGPRPLTLLSAGGVSLHGVIDVSGSPGSNGAIGVEGGGGGGGGGAGGSGGAIAIFTEGSYMEISGSILANGAEGGAGGAPGTVYSGGTGLGGFPGLPGVGASTGGFGGDGATVVVSYSGGKGGKGGDGADCGNGGGGGGGGGGAKYGVLGPGGAGKKGADDGDPGKIGGDPTGGAGGAGGTGIPGWAYKGGTGGKGGDLNGGNGKPGLTDTEAYSGGGGGGGGAGGPTPGWGGNGADGRNGGEAGDAGDPGGGLLFWVPPSNSPGFGGFGALGGGGAVVLGASSGGIYNYGTISTLAMPGEPNAGQGGVYIFVDPNNFDAGDIQGDLFVDPCGLSSSEFFFIGGTGGGGGGGGGGTATGATEDIPTLTEWGLIIMTMFLLALGAVMIKRRLRTVPA